MEKIKPEKNYSVNRLRISFLAALIGFLSYTIFSFAFLYLLTYIMTNGQAGSPYRRNGFMSFSTSMEVLKELILIYYSPIGAIVGFVSVFLHSVPSKKKILLLISLSWFVFFFLILIIS